MSFRSSTDATSLRFGRCEMNLLRRELRVDGQPVVLPRKVYELLVLLLQHRDRVVTKEALRAALWPGAALTDSVLARTVMKARRLIRDSGDQPQWIGSVHGVGYRFIGPVTAVSPPVAEPASLPPAPADAGIGPPREEPGRAALRVAVLPFVNTSGDATLDWTSVGLMTLVTHALGLDPRALTVPVPALLQAVPVPELGLPRDLHVRRAFEAFGVDRVVHASLSRQRNRLWLDFQVFDARGPAAVVSLRGNDVLALGEDMARSLVRALFREPGADAATAAGDPFVSQAMARALALVDEEDYVTALPLFSLVRSAVPECRVASLWHARCLARVGHPQALAAARAFLQMAEDAADLDDTVNAHLLIARNLAHEADAGQRALVQAHLRAVEEVLAREARDVWRARLHEELGYLSTYAGEFAQTEAHWRRAAALYIAAGDDAASRTVQRRLGFLAAQRGDLLGAREIFQDGLAEHRRAGRTRSSAYCLCWLALLNSSLGLLDVAVAQADEVLALLGGAGYRRLEPLMLSGAALVYAERLDRARVERAFRPLEEASDASHPMANAPRLAIAGVKALCEGDVERARQLLDRAIAEVPELAGAAFIRMWKTVLLRLELAAGDLDAAARLQACLPQVPGAGDLPETRGTLLHAQAARLLHQGDAAVALATLLRIVEQVPMGREHACARLDAAWLCTESGDTATAGRLLAAIPGWCTSHPLGLATQARLHFELGEHAQAERLQRQAVGQIGGRVAPWLLGAAEQYAAAAKGQGAAAPRLAMLVSDSWLASAKPD